MSAKECDYLTTTAAPLLSKCTGRKCMEMKDTVNTGTNTILERLEQVLYVWGGREGGRE